MKKILIVEDDEDIQDIFEIIFKSYGYQVECIDNGKTLCERSDDWPDAIILDKQLPGMSGVEACRFLKLKPETKNIPIIMISATSGVEKAAEDAGADDFLEKPFNMHVIIKKVEALLKKP
jgi:DNA-binding response OmpR family regulator